MSFLSLPCPVSSGSSSACHDGSLLPCTPCPSSHSHSTLQSTSALLSNPYRLPAGCKEKPELSISLPSFHPRPTASFPLPGCLLWMLLWNNASCDKTNHQLWSQVCSLGRARRDSSSPFPETTAETCHIQSVPLWWPISPSQGWWRSPWLSVSLHRSLGLFQMSVLCMTSRTLSLQSLGVTLAVTRVFAT